MAPTTKPEFMQVTESFSGTLEERNGKEIQRLPVTLNKGQVFEADHRYVKQWPQFFAPMVSGGQVVVSR